MQSSAHRPVLGVICCNRSIDGQAGQSVMTRYLNSALRYAEAAGLLIPAMPGLFHAREVAPRIDGLLLTGTPSNLDPKRYGALAEDALGPFDPDRDEMTSELIAAMLDLGKPVFGICRGLQELNVAFGGTLRRDMAEHPDLLRHHAPDGVSFEEMFDHIHPVRLEEDGILKRAYGRDALDIVSVHYQGVDALGAGLRVEARAPDGVIEAVSANVNGAPVLAVQWHPEWKASENPQSQLFFQLLGRALRNEPLV
ncbi:MAG: gamma-glutamyl-gamma-aminobutyrate hydrolase family protein [Hyphomonadaceae bacterium]|jgi:putative glutamine amidotransferase